MKIVLNIKNKAEASMLTAFLDAMKITYKASSEIDGEIESYQEFLNEYNREIDAAVNEIESGRYVSHKDAKKQLANRRKGNDIFNLV